jgi:uracil-DNA glycosylase family 4
MKPSSPELSKLELLQWYLDVGADETIGESTGFFQAAAASMKPATPPAILPKAPGMPSPAQPSPPASPSSAMAEARALADQATTLEALEAAVRNFNGLAIKKTATNTVFSDGNSQARIMLIGEAPGASEDAQGIPFCGKSGQLLDSMLAAIGLDRTQCYITNVLFWRPPGNRRPTEEELDICKPLVERHIALIHPDLLILSGGTATSTLIDKTTGITKLRQKTHRYTNGYMDYSVPTHAVFHPSYLLRQPLQKKLAWEDLLTIKHQLEAK